MHLKIQLISRIAVTAVLLGCAVSCGEQSAQDPIDTKTDVSTAESISAVEEEENLLALHLPERDFGGSSYRILCYQQADRDSLYSDAVQGEVVNDAVFNRNLQLTEQYNFNFQVDIEADQDASVRRFIMAGEDAYELIYGHVVTTCNNAIEGLFRNLYAVPNLDFSKPWWPAQSVEQMTVYDRMYTICSGINYNQLAASKVLFFNKDILASHDIELPYDAVRNGTWTMEKLIGATRGVYEDLNSNGEKDAEDLFGFSTYSTQNGFLLSCDTQILSPTADGGREITVMSDKMADLVDKLYSWYYETNDVLPINGEENLCGLFGNGHAAYTFGHLRHATMYYRNDDIAYGIAPMPKYDEAQENYYVFACPSLFSIPISAENEDFAGFVFEAMTYLGYYDVIPAYYEITLKGKIADSKDDAEMLSIINDHLTVSFAYCYDNWEGFAHLLGSRLNFTEKRGNMNLASVYEKYKKTAQRRLDAVLKGFQMDET